MNETVQGDVLQGWRRYSCGGACCISLKTHRTCSFEAGGDSFTPVGQRQEEAAASEQEGHKLYEMFLDLRRHKWRRCC